MEFVFLLVLGSVVTLFILRKDRLYRKKPLKEVLSENVRKEVNLPTEDDEFPQKFSKKQIKQESLSKKILQSINEKK